MAGGQVTYQFGYCPYNFRPFCCAAAVSLLLFPDDPSQAVLILNCKRSSRVWRLAVVPRPKSTSLLINDTLREVGILYDYFMVLEQRMIIFLVFEQVIKAHQEYPAAGSRFTGGYKSLIIH